MGDNNAYQSYSDKHLVVSRTGKTEMGPFQKQKSCPKGIETCSARFGAAKDDPTNIRMLLEENRVLPEACQLNVPLN